MQSLTIIIHDRNCQRCLKKVSRAGRGLKVEGNHFSPFEVIIIDNSNSDAVSGTNNGTWCDHDGIVEKNVV